MPEKLYTAPDRSVALEAVNCETHHNCFECGTKRPVRFHNFRIERDKIRNELKVLADCGECSAVQLLRTISVMKPIEQIKE